MNVEEITKKLEEIRADAFERASSHDEQSKTQLEDYNRVELDEDVAGEDVKLERTKGKDFPTPKTLSRATSMDGGKGPKEDIYVNDATLKAPSIDELQNKLDSLKKNGGSEILKIKIVTDREGNKMKISDYTIPRTLEELNIAERGGLITFDEHRHMGMGHQVWGAPNGKWYCLAHSVRINDPR